MAGRGDMGGEKEEEGVRLVREWVWCGLDSVRMCWAGNKAVVSSVPFSIPSVLRSASVLVGATLCLLVQIGVSRGSERNGQWMRVSRVNFAGDPRSVRAGNLMVEGVFQQRLGNHTQQRRKHTQNEEKSRFGSVARVNDVQRFCNDYWAARVFIAVENSVSL